MRGHEARQVLPGDPGFALPVQCGDALVGPGHEDASRAGLRVAVVVVEGGDHFVAEPLTEGAMLGVAEAVEGAVEAGFADQFHFFAKACAVAQVGEAELVRVEALGQPIRPGGGDHQGEVEGDEPGAVVDHDGAQLMAVALEGDGGKCVMHGVTPTKSIYLPPFAVNRRVANRTGLTDRLVGPADPRVSPRDLP